MNGDLVDEADSFEAEGVEAFNRMTNAMQGLQTRMNALDTGLASKVAQAERAASKAETAAQNAIQATQHAEATAHAGARQTASWAILGALAGILGAGGAGYWLGHASGQEIGRADGYKTAMDEKAAASWANTPPASSPSPSTKQAACPCSPDAPPRTGKPKPATDGASAFPCPTPSRTSRDGGFRSRANPRTHCNALRNALPKRQSPTR